MKELVLRHKNNKPTERFPQKLREFAETVYYLSPSAYRNIRELYFKCLPSPETLKSWNRSPNFKPGIHHQKINQISDKIRSKSKKSYFNLTFDEI